ncbi:glutathione S-transferase family protein [uncultured Parasphingorhabdus sp.]|uniref:glutathione S-transferase family protein n=1 Tax=uncultured Parasphingorhabdus sp. TaxID=2709694 RepID=UPI002AA721C7|nr:glutathione S-transferase family protein [uncultured Parasphingorhabdus sp.]
MKLYGVYLSPFATSIMMLLEAKSVDYELVMPPGGLGSEEFGHINYMQRIPVLESDDGDFVYESAVIAQYIDELYPMPNIAGSSPLEAAQNRTLARLADLYLLHGFLAVSGELREKRFDSDVVKHSIATAQRGLRDVEETMKRTEYQISETFTYADCFLIPGMHVVDLLLPIVGHSDYLADLPTLSAYWKAAQSSERHGFYIDKMRQAVKLRQETGEAM